MIYTKTGDMGTTSLLGGARVSKSDLRVRAYGAVDELEAVLGWATVPVEDSEALKLLRTVQGYLFDAGADLATAPDAPKPRIFASHVVEVEAAIDAYSPYLGGFRFVRSGECEASSRLHMARTVARRAEREIVALAEQEAVNHHLVVFVNRLSDLLYTLARFQSLWSAVRQQAAAILPEENPQEGLAGRLTALLPLVLAYSQRQGKGFAAAVADADGSLQWFYRHPETLPVSTALAMNKAFTAASLRMSTETAGQLAQPGAMLYGIGSAEGGRIVTFGGGLPLESGSRTVGAVGVSGGSVEEDIALALQLKAVLEGK